MNLEIGNVYGGFKLLETRELKEIGAKGLIFTHEKTKAKLLKIVKDDDNKVFSIGFRTPPEDSTGLPHILEHSVLCGSRKFDTKEPFVELLKGSLNTFLNAMTYPDKTIYPVASKNEKDFFNLMDVYLDAVLYPNIYKHKEIFMQEGWHYSIDDKDAPLAYNGVVYNEMKGAYSSPDSVLYRKIPSTLYPDTCYALSSGGDPEEIPNLSYEQFIAFHKKYYHPSNSYIFLYGNGDTLKELEFINDNYLKDFSEVHIDSEIAVQPTFEEMVYEKLTYGVAENETLDGKSYYSLNFVIGDQPHEENYFAFEVLTYLLISSTAAPLKKALLEAGIGKAVSGDFNGCIKQPTFTVLVKNGEAGQEEKFKKIVMDTLKQLVEKGIDKELIEASLNRVEFELREGDYGSYPEGLIHYLKVMDSWLYGGEPMQYLEYDKVLSKVKTALTTNYFEQLIEKYLLNNTHCSLVSLHPAYGINEKKEQDSIKKLEEKKESLTDKEIQAIVENCAKLRERQNTPDTPEQLECIPALSLDDIDRKAENLSVDIKEINGVKALHHNFHTNKIAYVSLLFNSKGVPQDLIPFIGLLTDIFGKCGTDKYDYSKLSNLVNINTGGVGYTPMSVSNVKNFGDYSTFIEVSFKCLEDKVEKTLELIENVIFNTDFNDEGRIKQLIGEKKARLEGSIISNGHRIAMKKVLSYAFNRGAYDEKISGLEYYDFLVKLEEKFDGKSIKENLNAVRNAVFNRSNLIISYSGIEEDYNSFKEKVASFIEVLSTDRVGHNIYSFDLGNKNEGLLTQGNVQYVAKGGNYKLDGYEYNGALSLVETILGFDYLWNNVRVKGGAYGVFSNFRRDGGAYIVSYRDPNIKETLDIYEKIPNYLANFTGDEKEMTKYIIGTIRNQDHPISNSSRGYISTSYYLAGLSYEDLQRERDQVLEADENTIRKFAPLVSDLLRQQYICVLGNENKIKEQTGLFNKLVKVIK